MDQGQRAVGEAVELGQAAGLEAAGHEDDVAAGKDAVGQALVHAGAVGDLQRVAAAAWLNAASSRASPAPSTMSWAAAVEQVLQRIDDEGRPFCSVRRLTMAKSGAVGVLGQAMRLCSAALVSGLALGRSAS